MRHRPAHNPNQQQQQTANVQGAWLLKALAAVFAAAIVCVYLTLCFLFYRGQWQIVLHPVKATSQEPAVNLIRFDPDVSAQPQLTGEWLPAASGSHYSNLTILFFAGGDGPQSSFASTQADLRNLGLNVFAFDYRGYGQSADVHPSEQRMTEDSEAAWSYLTTIRGVSSAAIVPYGVGVGTSLAARLALEHPEIPGVILDRPYTDLREVIERDTRFRFLPSGLLFHEDFPLAKPLSQLQRPKLLIAATESSDPAVFRTAADPKIMVSLAASSGPAFDEAVTRFLDQYLTVPSPTPSATNPR
jgi:pimeloyl-ACP methyl ester carboxylesterase